MLSVVFSCMQFKYFNFGFADSRFLKKKNIHSFIQNLGLLYYSIIFPIQNTTIKTKTISYRICEYYQMINVLCFVHRINNLSYMKSLFSFCVFYHIIGNLLYPMAVCFYIYFIFKTSYKIKKICNKVNKMSYIISTTTYKLHTIQLSEEGVSNIVNIDKGFSPRGITLVNLDIPRHTTAIAIIYHIQ